MQFKGIIEEGEVEDFITDIVRQTLDNEISDAVTDEIKFGSHVTDAVEDALNDADLDDRITTLEDTIARLTAALTEGK